MLCAKSFILCITLWGLVKSWRKMTSRYQSVPKSGIIVSLLPTQPTANQLRRVVRNTINYSFTFIPISFHNMAIISLFQAHNDFRIFMCHPQIKKKNGPVYSDLILLSCTFFFLCLVFKKHQIILLIYFRLVKIAGRAK